MQIKNCTTTTMKGSKKSILFLMLWIINIFVYSVNYYSIFVVVVMVLLFFYTVFFCLLKNKLLLLGFLV